MLLPKFASKSDGPYRRPRVDVYTVLLIIALIALLLGIICLYGEMSVYEFETDGGPTVSVGLVPTAKPQAATRDYLPLIWQNARTTDRRSVPHRPGSSTPEAAGCRGDS